MKRYRFSVPAALASAAMGTVLSSGCSSTTGCCESTCEPSCAASCETCGTGSCGGSSCWPSWLYPHSNRNAIPDILPLGAVSRAHWHMQETNGEAADFVIHRNEFVDNSSELTPYGRDHIAEIAARMPSAPFPVLVQRSLNNADPELDNIRRDIVVRVLTDLGNPDADQRTVVSQPYSNGINSMEGEQDYGRFRNIRGNFNRGSAGGGIGGGF
jgi:hypothetical protein